MLTVLAGCALAVAGAPLGAIVLVSVASRREDRAWSLAGQPRGPVQAAARRILACRCDGQVPRPRSRTLAGPASGTATRAGQSPRPAASRQLVAETSAAGGRAR